VLWMAIHRLECQKPLTGDAYWTELGVRVETIPDDLWVELSFDGFAGVRLSQTGELVWSGRLSVEMMAAIKRLLPGDTPRPHDKELPF
jgi:hypothetical protein